MLNGKNLPNFSFFLFFCVSLSVYIFPSPSSPSSPSSPRKTTEKFINEKQQLLINYL